MNIILCIGCPEAPDVSEDRSCFASIPKSWHNLGSLTINRLASRTNAKPHLTLFAVGSCSIDRRPTTTHDFVSFFFPRQLLFDYDTLSHRDRISRNHGCRQVRGSCNRFYGITSIKLTHWTGIRDCRKARKVSRREPKIPSHAKTGTRSKRHQHSTQESTHTMSSVKETTSSNNSSVWARPS